MPHDLTIAICDTANRMTAMVQVGTNGGSVYTHPSSIPARLRHLAGHRQYDAAGRLEDQVDPKGLTTKTLYNALGRTKSTIENYVDGVPSDADDQIVQHSYNGAGQPLSLTVVMPAEAFQETRYVYGASTSRGDGLYSNRLMIATQYPDKTTGEASSSQQDSYTFNALGERVTATDRNGTERQFHYDVLGRLSADIASTLGTGVDGAVRRIGFSTAQGLQDRLRFSDTGGSAVVNQVSALRRPGAIDWRIPGMPVRSDRHHSANSIPTAHHQLPTTTVD